MTEMLSIVEGAKCDEPSALYAFVTELLGYADVDEVRCKGSHPDCPVYLNTRIYSSIRPAGEKLQIQSTENGAHWNDSYILKWHGKRRKDMLIRSQSQSQCSNAIPSRRIVPPLLV